MSETLNEAELGRSRKGITPADHLKHLLTIGWRPSSPLITRYIAKYRLQNALSEWQAGQSHADNNNEQD